MNTLFFISTIYITVYQVDNIFIFLGITIEHSPTKEVQPKNNIMKRTIKLPAEERKRFLIINFRDTTRMNWSEHKRFC
jgi:hypothetical protein